MFLGEALWPAWLRPPHPQLFVHSSLLMELSGICVKSAAHPGKLELKLKSLGSLCLELKAFQLVLTTQLTSSSYLLLCLTLLKLTSK